MFSMAEMTVVLMPMGILMIVMENDYYIDDDNDDDSDDCDV